MKGHQMQIDIDQLIAKLEAASFAEVARATGLPYNTVKNVIERRNPTLKTLEKLQEYFDGKA
jgi:DNA-directed RNA polymerase specialized sigma24 family protein